MDPGRQLIGLDANMTHKRPPSRVFSVNALETGLRAFVVGLRVYGCFKEPYEPAYIHLFGTHSSFIYSLRVGSKYQSHPLACLSAIDRAEVDLTIVDHQCFCVPVKYAPRVLDPRN